MDFPRIAITTGEPAGIGPDIIASALLQEYPAAVTVFGDVDVIRHRSQQLGLDCQIQVVNPDYPPIPHKPGRIDVVNIPCGQPVVAGEGNPANSTQVVRCIDQATDGCLSGVFSAIVTAPVHKALVNDAGIAFTGHTEWIAARCKAPLPVMMLADDRMRVCLATIHMPLSAVPAAITQESLTNILRIMDNDLRSLVGLDNPAIGICGLNPHAGENGYLGMEEIDVIAPAIDKLKQQGMNLAGPLPADTIFTAEYLNEFDAILAMYHDQGLPVIKHQGFGGVVNVTLGLPIIRTSVDHGTAFSLAASGQADASSMQSAIEMAISFSNNRAETMASG